MKTDKSIENITKATINRHSMNPEEWVYTKIIASTSDLENHNEIILNRNEIPLVLSHKGYNQWTLITTQRITGKNFDELCDVEFNYIDDIIFGDFKGLNGNDCSIFRVVDIDGKCHDYFMETGKASIAIIYGFRTVNKLFKSSNR